MLVFPWLYFYGLFLVFFKNPQLAGFYEISLWFDSINFHIALNIQHYKILFIGSPAPFLLEHIHSAFQRDFFKSKNRIMLSAPNLPVLPMSLRITTKLSHYIGSVSACLSDFVIQQSPNPLIVLNRALLMTQAYYFHMTVKLCDKIHLVIDTY